MHSYCTHMYLQMGRVDKNSQKWKLFREHIEKRLINKPTLELVCVLKHNKYVLWNHKQQGYHPAPLVFVVISSFNKKEAFCLILFSVRVHKPFPNLHNWTGLRLQADNLAKHPNWTWWTTCNQYFLHPLLQHHIASLSNLRRPPYITFGCSNVSNTIANK